MAGRPINGKPSAIAAAAVDLFLSRRPDLAALPEHRVHRYSIDLAFPSLMLAVELDGIYWHSLPAMQAKDQRKDKALAERGWRVVRIPIDRESTAESLAAAIAEAVSAATPTEASHDEAFPA